MSTSQTKLVTALAALRAMSRESGMCLGHTRVALKSANLSLPDPMPSPRNTALANFTALVANPANYGWQSVGLDDAFPIKLVYFDEVAWLDNPPRWAGHVGLLSNGTIYSDSDYQLSSWWRSKFAGAFVPLGDAPRLIVAKPGGPTPAPDGNTYQEIPSEWNASSSTLAVDVASLQAFLGTNLTGLASKMPVRDAFAAIGASATFNLTHIEDPIDPRVYAFA